MADRRKVNTARPEHSWIPFYRELAEKLVNDGWRDRQGELVRLLKRLRESGIPIHSIADNLTDHVDPFTIFALFSRGISFDNMLRVMDALKSEFGISSSLPKEQPFIPYANNLSIGYFWGFDDIEDEIETIWDIFEIVRSINSFDEITTDESLVELIESGLQIKGVRISKLTSAFYWVNPNYFLHSDTVNAVGGKDLRIKAINADSYIRCLVRTGELTERSFPETNVEVFKSENPDWDPPKIWIVRGGSSGQPVDYQIENGVAGIDFNLEDVDLSRLLDDGVVRQAYSTRNPDAGEGRVRAQTGSVMNFVRDIRMCDYVLMPDGDGQRIHYGKVVSDPYHVPNGPWENRRDIEWADRVLIKPDLPSFPTRTRTVTQASDGVKEEFWTWFESSDLPDDESDDNEIDGESDGIRAYGIDDMVNDDDLFFKPDELRRMHSRFEDKKNLILQGPPGVGKTFVLKRLAYALMGEEANGRIRNVQFHQSYSYEDFVEGYRPGVNDRDELVFKMQKGSFLRLCDEAVKEENDGKRFVMVIDEINRGNLSRVFGELLSMIEKDKRGDGFTIRLAGGNEFSVPENVYILGTMNLADRSLAGMDYAMRRRFAFVTLEPQFGESVFQDWLRERNVPDTMIDRINDRMSALNREIANDRSLGRNFAVGHSYFCDIPAGAEAWQDDDWDRWYRNIVETEIQPLLEEYWFDSLTKADEAVDKLLDGLS